MSVAKGWSKPKSQEEMVVVESIVTAMGQVAIGEAAAKGQS